MSALKNLAMNSKSVEFVNPDMLPADNLTLSVKGTGVLQHINALDPHWVENRELIVYERPPSGSTLVLGAIDAWKTKIEIYYENLKWLLMLEHHKFWSTVIYHSQCMDSLVSFLQEASPPYLPPHESRDVQKLYNDIRKLVFVVFCRLITNKESKTQWLTKSYMADVLYNKFIFTIPIIWDICLVYGVDNPQPVARLLASLFALQPNYEQDTIQAIRFVNETFKYIILQVNKDYDNDEPPNLPETFQGFSEIKRPTDKVKDKLTFPMLKDLVVHLLDSAMTLRIFVEVYPGCVEALRKTNFIISIVQLYEYGVPLLYEKLEEVGDETSVSYTEIENNIECARAELIDIFREVLAVYKSSILNGEGSIEVNVENYLAVLMDGLSERLLIQDYHACYPVNEDLEILKQLYPDIDPVKTDFILQAIYSNLNEPVPETSGNGDVITNGHVETIDNSEPTRDNEIPDNIKEDSLISEVKDILPHLGDGFILRCLKHYGFNAERVINSILEGNLAEPLKELDQSLPIIPEDPLDAKFLETGIARLNVFDGDQFDIMNRDDVDVSRIHVGKKRGKYRDLKDMLNDKTEVKKFGDVYSKYNLVCDDVAMYSDEYDDTYDSDGVAPTPDTADDLGRPFVTPRALMTRRVEEESEESEGEQEESNMASSSTSVRNKLDFCQNPEEIRARREANYQARRGRGKGPSNRNIDVTGKPKGQGQEKEVLANRDKKEKHKSSKANHSRRQGAQWKRSQGMMPS